MASPPLDQGIFAQLRKPIDPKVIEQREREISERVHAAYEKAEQRQNEILRLNSTAPVTISEIQLLNAEHTRHRFLERIFKPLLSENRRDGGYYTLREAVGEVTKAVEKLNRLDIFHQPISTFFDKPDPTNPASSPSDYVVSINARERGRYQIQTGTEAGSAEGSAYLNVVLRNLFGGAERLNANASVGTRTRTAYSATFDTPILSNPDLRWELTGLRSSTIKPWASHEEILQGGQSRLLWQTSPFTLHSLTYSGLWRQVTGLASNASPTVRGDAGDSFKSSLTYSWTRDTRDSAVLPSRGLLIKTVSELAGFGPLRGDVAFSKFTLDTQATLPIPIPFYRSSAETGISLTTSFRTGLITPLPLAGQQSPSYTRINDRFTLGGPTDVRGFRLAGLGPRDGPDAVGGDVFAAAGSSLLLPFPYVGKESPLRFQLFVNAGRLLAFRDTRSTEKDKDTPMTTEDAFGGVARTFTALYQEAPSTAAGFGVVYAHPAARVEVNFSLPLIIRKGEEGRKGLGFGVGVEVL